MAAVQAGLSARAPPDGRRSFVLSQLAALPDALLALWLGLLGEGVFSTSRHWIEVAAVGLGVSDRGHLVSAHHQHASAAPLPRQGDHRAGVARGQTAGLHRRPWRIRSGPEYLDRLSMLRNQVFVLDHMYMSLFSTLGWILRLGVTMALLASIHPALLLLAVFAIPTVLTSAGGPASRARRRSKGRKHNRLSRHLFTLATTAAPGKEVRVTGIGERLVSRSPRGLGALVLARGVGALGLGMVARARLGDIRLRVRRRGGLRRPDCGRQPAQVLLVLAAGARLSGVHRRNSWRDRLPARILDGRLA